MPNQQHDLLYLQDHRAELKEKEKKKKKKKKRQKKKKERKTKERNSTNIQTIQNTQCLPSGRQLRKLTHEAASAACFTCESDVLTEDSRCHEHKGR